MKKCFKCGEVKPLDDFYKHSQMADGHVNKCIVCNKKDVHEHRVLQIDKIREYDRERGSTKKRIERNSARMKIYKKEHPEKVKARAKANDAVRCGKMVKKPCAVCGTTKRIEKHHPDYAKPLEVVFLCSVHHKRAHGMGQGYE